MDYIAAGSEHPMRDLRTYVRWALLQANRRGALMRDSDREPFGPVITAALVARVIVEVDRRSVECRDELLLDLLCAAWPSRLAQEQ
jgi:hypothetical protein